MDKKVNNQHKKGYDHGYSDGNRGSKRKFRHSRNWSDYAIKTYKKGYGDGYKQGSIKKKQDDRRANQMRGRNGKGQEEASGCMLVFLAVGISVLTLMLSYQTIFQL